MFVLRLRIVCAGVCVGVSVYVCVEASAESVLQCGVWEAVHSARRNKDMPDTLTVTGQPQTLTLMLQRERGRDVEKERG